ncbi:AAA family ATPase [Salmonella enterica]|nr:AAA family ATPase [Salmonella enterica]ECI4039823.1 hypothetical protein [Salmonella enterica subsp. houtenae]HBJ6996168.1 AAA family ATPase [Salmonella enterica subsp. houtenae serovar 50:g,z51:-]EAO7824402.1 hypothetical protein [Salmonella enterica]EAQ7683134.1 hypothetical protein [Salmonella enterica]
MVNWLCNQSSCAPYNFANDDIIAIDGACTYYADGSIGYRQDECFEHEHVRTLEECEEDYFENELGIKFERKSELLNDVPCTIEQEENKLNTEKRLRPVIENLFNRKQVGFLYGESNTGKSFAALSLLNRIAQGKSWAGLRVAKECHAFYFDGETGVEIKDRNKAWGNKFNGGNKNSRMHVLSPKINLFDKNIQDIIIHDVNKMTKGKGGIICFDTLSSFLAYFNKKSIDGSTEIDMQEPDENDAIAMRKLVSILKRIAVETNSFVLMVHHGGKDAAKGMKGAITLKNDSDTVIKLEQVNNTTSVDDYAFSVSLTVEKNRSAIKLPAKQFDLCLESTGITQAELKEYDDDLCAHSIEMGSGYNIKPNTKTLVFVDIPRDLPEGNKGVPRPSGNGAAFDTTAPAQNNNQQDTKNEYQQIHASRESLTPKQQLQTLEQNSVNGINLKESSEFTANAKEQYHDDYKFKMNCAKLSHAKAQLELYKLICGILRNSHNEFVSVKHIENEAIRIIDKTTKSNIKRNIDKLVTGNFLIEGSGKQKDFISLPKPPAQVMTGI